MENCRVSRAECSKWKVLKNLRNMRLLCFRAKNIYVERYHFVSSQLPGAPCVFYLFSERHLQSGCCTLIRCDLLTHYIHRTIIVAINLKWMHLNCFILAPPTFNPISHLIKSKRNISQLFCICINIIYISVYHIHCGYTLFTHE